MTEDLAIVRRRFADEIGRLADVTWPSIVPAFAAVPRERFVGPGPWKSLSSDLKPIVTPDADPVRVYANIVIALDETKGLTNGQPQFWAALFEQLRPKTGERVIHVGAGVGYYTAILAEMVGSGGRVTGIEFEPALAARAVTNLAAWPQAQVLAGDAHALARGPADIVVASCGFDAVPLPWVRLLEDGGRLLIPLTVGSSLPGVGAGAMLLVTRRDAAFDARFAGGTMIYHDMSGRSGAATRKLAEAFAAYRGGPAPAIASLRIGTPPDETCWLAGDGWWISTAPNP
jgi:protein-L-isoaspartate(D-aspartate) O-methyltransferase